MDEERQDRPGDLAETPDADVTQDPGVPGAKFPDSEEPRQGFASNAEKDPDASERIDEFQERTGRGQGS